MPVYATSAEYEVFAGGESPDDLARLLERASEVIGDFTKTAWYATDDHGMPTDEDVLEALRKATCAQVEFWMAGDEEDDILGPVNKLSLGGMSFEGKMQTIAPRAARILRNSHVFRSEARVL